MLWAPPSLSEGEETPDPPCRPSQLSSLVTVGRLPTLRLLQGPETPNPLGASFSH